MLQSGTCQAGVNMCHGIADQSIMHTNAPRMIALRAGTSFTISPHELAPGNRGLQGRSWTGAMAQCLHECAGFCRFLRHLFDEF